MRTVAETITALPVIPGIQELPAPVYTENSNPRKIALAVESHKRHTTDEGWQITDGLGRAGYKLCGRHLEVNENDVDLILKRTDPGTAFVQDKREWGFAPSDFRDPDSRFYNMNVLQPRSDIFKVTILKDAQGNRPFHIESANELNVHGWVIYYHPQIVKRLAPYVRLRHLIRTYHSVELNDIPPFDHVPDRKCCLLSGAVSRCYPFRTRLFSCRKDLFQTVTMKHPGYHINGTVTPAFLLALSSFKVSICTSSMYGYALRKIIESTACGCRVITDLPVDEILPEIDDNLIRVRSTISIREMNKVIENAITSYSPTQQERLAEAAKRYYNVTATGARLAADIETLRTTYTS